MTFLPSTYGVHQYLARCIHTFLLIFPPNTVSAKTLHTQTIPSTGCLTCQIHWSLPVPRRCSLQVKLISAGLKISFVIKELKHLFETSKLENSALNGPLFFFYKVLVRHNCQRSKVTPVPICRVRREHHNTLTHSDETFTWQWVDEVLRDTV